MAEQPAPAEPVRQPGSAAAAREPALRVVLGTRRRAPRSPASARAGATETAPAIRSLRRLEPEPAREREGKEMEGGKRRRGAGKLGASRRDGRQIASKFALACTGGACSGEGGGRGVCVRRSRVGRPEEGSVFPASCTQLPLCGAPSLACHFRLWHLSRAPMMPKQKAATLSL